MSERRNPRVDPQKGDVLQRGGVKRTVLQRRKASIIVFDQRAGEFTYRAPTLKQFQQWAATLNDAAIKEVAA